MDNTVNQGQESKPENKVLFRVTNLKQYFPIRRKRNMFVKANDGVSLDLYEGETIGVVGESGCGKTTLGRVMLQLYRQTDGETIYFGRSRDSIAPGYVLKTYERMDEMCRQAQELVAARDKLKSEVEAMDQTEGPELFAKREELVKVTSKAQNAFYAVVSLIGGFYAGREQKVVMPLFIKLHEATKAQFLVEQKLSALRLKKDRLENRNKPVAALNEKIAELEKLNEQRKAAVEARYAEINQIREERAGDEEFQKYEALRNDGIDLAKLTFNEMRFLRKDLQIIFQDPYSSLNPRMTVGQILGEGVTTHKYFSKHDKRLQDYTMRVMEQCGLASYMIHRYPHQFSGGQRQRIGIARALAVKPRFVVCDEAVSALDVSIQSQIINLLQELKEQEKLTYMFISHDLSVIKYISDRIAVMYLGNIVELTTSAKLFEDPLHPYTEALLNAIPTTEERNESDLYILQGDIPSPINPPKGCKFHTRCRYRTDICKEVTPDFVEQVPGHFVACHHKKEGRTVTVQ